MKYVLPLVVLLTLTWAERPAHASGAGPAPDSPTVRASALLSSQSTSAGRREVLESLKNKPFAQQALRDAGDTGIVALIEMQVGAHDLKNRNWASIPLESLGKRTPSDVVQMKNPGPLVNVLDAYGAKKSLDALTVILSLLSTDNTHVRQAAQRAIRAFGRDAVWKTKEVYQTLTGQSGEALDFEAIAKGIFDATDKLRTHDVDSRLDEGLLRIRAGQTTEGISALEDALARQPATARKGEVVAALLDSADQLRDANRPLAKEILQRTLRLSAGSPRENAVRARLAFLDADERASMGAVAIRPLYERAVALDPNFLPPRQLLNKLDDQRAERARAGLWWPLAASAFVVAAAVAVLFVRRPRRVPLGHKM
jgi:hypothetical protein